MQRSQNIRNPVFSSFFACLMLEGSGSGSVPLVREAQKHVDPVDPDPEHYL
jgi:hypothetical protein